VTVKTLIVFVTCCLPFRPTHVCLQEWKDTRLRWRPEDYSGLEMLRIPCQRLWLPDIVLYNRLGSL